MPRAVPPAPTTRFEGFADARMKFFHALSKHQDRAWFAGHKAEYEAGWATPMQGLLAEARAKLDSAYPHVELAEPKVFRLHRDVRFAADKSPYKTNVSGVVTARKKGFQTSAAEELKSAPRGIDPAHPRIALLKKKGLVVSFPPIPAGAVTGRPFLDWVATEARRAAPLVTWLVFETL
jgi:uncharacterized protein (DUF2461 family)